MVQAVAAEVEQLEVFGQQELFGPEMFDAVIGQIHLHYVREQISWDMIQICRDRGIRISESGKFDTNLSRIENKNQTEKTVMQQVICVFMHIGNLRITGRAENLVCLHLYTFSRCCVGCMQRLTFPRWSQVNKMTIFYFCARKECFHTHTHTSPCLSVSGDANAWNRDPPHIQSQQGRMSCVLNQESHALTRLPTASRSLQRQDSTKES